MPDTKSKEQRRLELFAVEAQDAIHAITLSCLKLEQQPEAPNRTELIQTILRQTHTLKGASRALGLGEIANLTHKLETVFQAIQSGRSGRSTADFDLIYLTLDHILSLSKGKPAHEFSMQTLLEKLESTAEGAGADQTKIPQPPSPQGIPSDAPPSSELVRVTVENLDAILNLVNEMQVVRLSLERALEQMRSFLYGVNHPASQIEERSRFNHLYRRAESDQRRLSQLLFQLQENVRQARLLPLANVFDSLSRTARNLAHELGKEVALHVEGGDIEVDRSVLEQIKMPLQNLLHNSIDHGLEAPDQRLASGKPKTGAVNISVTQVGNHIRIDFSDDGAGIAPALLKEHAVRRSLLTPEQARQLDEREAALLIFQPGFSTADTITTVSGRGMGLDVVRQAVENMHGTLDMENRPGQGVRFMLNLPTSLATSPCLLVRVSDAVYALPAQSVKRLVRIRAGEANWKNGQLIQFSPEEEAVLALSLSRLFDPASQSSDTSSRAAILLDSPEQSVALLADELYDVQEIVIKKLPLPFMHVPYLSGASILGTGAVVLVLNPTDLIRTALRTS